MKIKNFICKNVTPDGLIAIEKEVNDFLENHEGSIDVKVSTICNNLGFMLIYTVLYEALFGEED